MQSSVPLLYASYIQIDHHGPVRKIKLPPVKTLIRYSVSQLKKGPGIKEYLTLYTSIFAIIGILVAACLALIQRS